MRARVVAIVAGLLTASAVFGSDTGPVAHWTFDAGAGDTAHDARGSNHGKICGAAWSRCGEGFALQFDGVDDYVDCGAGESLDLSGPVTLGAWVFPERLPDSEPVIAGKSTESYALTYYKSGGGYWYISGGGNNVSVPLRLSEWNYVAGTFDGATMRLFLNGKEVSARKSASERVSRGKSFLIGGLVLDPEPGQPGTGRRAHFCGMIDDVRVYNRALSAREMVLDFNAGAVEKGMRPLDAPAFDKLGIEPFVYYTERLAVLRINYQSLMPLPEGATVVGELSRGDEAPLQRVVLKPDPLDPIAEAAFSLADFSEGAYRLRAAVLDGARTVTEATADLVLKPPVTRVPAPDQEAVPPLPRPVRPPPYEMALTRGGGFTVRFADRVYKVESSYSYPRGGENRLAAGDPDSTGESSWCITTHRAGPNEYVVHAAGAFYLIERSLRAEPSRVTVKDRITNKTDEEIGIVLNNCLEAVDEASVRATRHLNPAVFLHAAGHGVGLIALDDVYQLHAWTHFEKRRIGIGDKNFGLGKRASYTIEWAVYPTATSDYYDFINQVRGDEGLNGTTIEGTLTAIRMNPVRVAEGSDGSADKGQSTALGMYKELPSRESLELVNAKYLRTGTPWYPIDDPTVSIEGIEFAVYPQESARLAEYFRKVRQAYPDKKVMFHVAHGLHVTGQPETLFPDSRVIDDHGNQRDYGGGGKAYYARYFSRERVEQNYRWWLFYAAPDNTFGRAMLAAVDFMLNDMQVDSLFGDGFVTGYALGYTYDRWDGHTVEMDPETKTVRRKMGHVTYLSLPVLKAVAEKIKGKGGVLITIDLAAAPRSLWAQDMITACETGGGDDKYLGALHLGRTVIGFGDPGRVKTERGLCRDILDKLEWGGLYFVYGIQPTRKTLVEHMYPITPESFHAGTVRGRERIVTKRSGIYGWPGDASLHAVYLYDQRGALIPHSFFSTASPSEVRTQVNLREDESAAIVKLPISIGAASPVNVLVERYDADAVKLLLRGHGRIAITLADGAFPIAGHESCTITLDEEDRTEPVQWGRLFFEVTAPPDRTAPLRIHIRNEKP